MSKTRKREINDLIKDWKKIYENDPYWLQTKLYTSLGNDDIHRRKLLGMAKVVCSTIAKTVWSSPPSINVSDNIEDGNEVGQKILDDILKSNNFIVMMRQYIEYMSAVGGKCIKVVYDKGNVLLDFIDASKFEIIQYDNGVVTGIRIKEYTKYNNKLYKLIEEQKVGYDEDGKRVYIVTFSLYDGNNQVSLSTVPEYASLSDEEIIYGINDTLFSYIKMTDTNNQDMGSPYGISAFANAIDPICSADIAYDSLNIEIENGLKRLFIPASMAETRIEVDEESGTEKVKRDFPVRNPLFMTYNDEQRDSSDSPIINDTQELRVDSLVKAINTHLDTIAMKTGFSPGTFSFDKATGLKTATEVVSNDRKTYANKSDLETEIANGIIRLVKIIFNVLNVFGDLNIELNGINVIWGDSLYDDEDKKYNRLSKQMVDGIMSRRRVMKETYGYSDEEIDQIFAEIQQEKAMGLGASDTVAMG